MIPKKIFQTWKEKKISHPILRYWQTTWTTCNPDYEYTIWDDDDNKKFINDTFPGFLHIYNAYTQNIKRVDAVRYFYLYEHGGIYADIDFVCLKNFDDICQMSDYDVIFGHLGKMDHEYYTQHCIPNALMMAKPKTDFFKFILKAIEHTDEPSLTPELATGPMFLFFCIITYQKRGAFPRDAVQQIFKKNIFDFDMTEFTFDSKILIAEQHIFYPINWDNKAHQKYRQEIVGVEQLSTFFPQSYAVTFWMHSWS